jgi:molybdopterin-guanine dinucleotide biosynthesis protein A
MGRPKGLIEVAGETLAARTARLLRSVCDPVVEVGPGWSGLEVAVETRPGAGPLAALADGWRHLRAGGFTGPVLGVATDLPRLDGDVLAWLATHPSVGSVVPLSGGRPQMLCARWSPADLARAVALVEGGHSAMRNLLEGSGAVLAGEEEWGATGALADADTPADLQGLGVGS